MKIKHNILIIILLLAVFAACTNDETCRKNRYVSMSAYFYMDTINKNTGDTNKVAATVSKLTVHGVGVDSILYNNANVGNIQLPLNQFADESKFVLKFNNVSDTLTVKHTNSYEFLSLECGEVRVHTINDVFVTNHFFTSVNIVNREINTTTTANAKNQNIQIHRFVK